jgi:hypothetical protein
MEKSKAKRLPRLKSVGPQTKCFIDFTILDELEKEGFFSKHCTGTETASDSIATTLAR